MIRRVYNWAKMRNALLFLDVQVGTGTLKEELPRSSAVAQESGRASRDRSGVLDEGRPEAGDDHRDVRR